MGFQLSAGVFMFLKWIPMIRFVLLGPVRRSVPEKRLFVIADEVKPRSGIQSYQVFFQDFGQSLCDFRNDGMRQ